MNKNDFGNYLYQLRKENNLTQRFVAYQLDVSDKAVSKWEMGKSKPDLDKIKLLSTLYNVPLNELLGVEEEKEVNPSLLETRSFLNSCFTVVTFLTTIVCAL